MRKPYDKLYFAKTLILAKELHGKIYFSTGYIYCKMHLNLHKTNFNLHGNIHDIINCRPFRTEVSLSDASWPLLYKLAFAGELDDARNSSQELRSSLQERGKWHETHLLYWYKYILNSTTYPGQPSPAKWSLGGPVFYKAPLKYDLAANGCPGFFVEFNTYNITKDKFHVAYPSLVQGGSQSNYI